MDIRNTILRNFAEVERDRISRRVIRTLMGMTESLTSGDGSGLVNLWEELCVQVQFEHSIFFNFYMDLVYGFVHKEITGLSPHIKMALWLQSSEGEDWSYEHQGNEHFEEYEEPYPLDCDLVGYVVDGVLGDASEWSNPRIRAFLAG